MRPSPNKFKFLMVILVAFAIVMPLLSGTYLCKYCFNQDKSDFLPFAKPAFAQIGEASVYLYGQITDVAVGDDIVLDLSAINPITKPTMTLQLVLKIPSGMSVTSAEFIEGGGGQYSATYTVEPGKTKLMGVHIRANQSGSFNVIGDIYYYFGTDKSSAQYRTTTLTITVSDTPFAAKTQSSGTSGGGGGLGWPTIVGIVIGALSVSIGLTRLVIRLRTGR